MMQLPDPYDVLVVGAGPAGLTTATSLARAGISVLVVDKHPGTSIFPKASGVRPRSLEILRSWGLEQQVRAGVQHVRLEQASSPTLSDPLAEVVSLGVPDPDRLASVSPTGFAFCPQDVLEPVLLDSFRRHGGHDRFGTELVGFDLDADGVRARLRRRDMTKPAYEVRAGYLVGADGADSPVRAALGIDVEHLGSEGDHLATLFYADFSSLLPDPPFALHQVTAHGAEGLFVAAGPHRWTYDREWHPEPGETLAVLSPERDAARIRAAAGLPGLNLRIAGLFPWTMGAQAAARYRHGPAFLVGDAAARTTPRGAFGMNTGIAAAHNLAWKLAWVLRGWAGEPLLDTYEQERRPVGLANAQRSLEVRDHEAEEFGSEDFGVRYSSTAVLAEDVAPTRVGPVGRVTRPGLRAPHAWVDLGGHRVSTLDLFEGQLTMLAGRYGAAWSASADRLGVPGPFGVLRLGVDLPDPDGTLARLYGIGEHGAVLVRPDGHVAWMTRTRTGTPTVLAEAVGRATGHVNVAQPSTARLSA